MLFQSRPSLCEQQLAVVRQNYSSDDFMKRGQKGNGGRTSQEGITLKYEATCGDEKNVRITLKPTFCTLHKMYDKANKQRKDERVYINVESMF